MNNNKLKQINEFLDNNLSNVFDTHQSMGLKNVDARLKLYFGNECGVNIKSDEQTGTKVIMTFTSLLEGDIK